MVSTSKKIGKTNSTEDEDRIVIIHISAVASTSKKIGRTNSTEDEDRELANCQITNSGPSETVVQAQTKGHPTCLVVEIARDRTTKSDKNVIDHLLVLEFEKYSNQENNVKPYCAFYSFANTREI